MQKMLDDVNKYLFMKKKIKHTMKILHQKEWEMIRMGKDYFIENVK